MRLLAHSVIIGFLFLAACNGKKNEINREEIVARVYNKVLLEGQLKKQLSANMDAQDSLNTTNRYINSWIERQLLVRQAELNIATNQAELDRKIEEYKNDLMIYSYQNQLLAQKLDTSISDQEIEEFYSSHKEMFKLQDYLVKVRFLQVDSANQSAQILRKQMMSDRDEELNELERFCYMHSAKYSLDDNWIYLSELQRKIPLEVSNKEKLLKNKKLIEFYDNGFLYFVRIVDGKRKGGTSPLLLEKNNIKNNILNNRRLAFLKKLKADILARAKKEQEIEILRK